MNVIFVAPNFPNYQRQFVRALKNVGANVIGIGESPYDWLDDEVKGALHEYEQVSSVTDEGALYDAVKRVQGRHWVDRLESTIESHMLPVAKVREACTIPGLSYEQVLRCRDKTLMKQVLRDHNIPTAASRSADSAEEVRGFVNQHGYPIVLKPRAGAGAAGTYRVDNDDELSRVLDEIGASGETSIAVEEFVEGHEGFYDTLTIGGYIRHDFVSHYYPNVLEAMRTRWISPVIITSNRIGAEGYDDMRVLGRQVIEALELSTTPTHMEWFFGPKGIKFSEIGVRPPGVGQWDLYCEANDIDLYGEWASAIVHGSTGGTLSRRYCAATINFRPSQDGHIERYEGVDEIQHKYGDLVFRSHFPPPGTPTQPVEAGYMANAWAQVKHPDYDELRRILTEMGETVKVIAS